MVCGLVPRPASEFLLSGLYVASERSCSAAQWPLCSLRVDRAVPLSSLRARARVDRAVPLSGLRVCCASSVPPRRLQPKRPRTSRSGRARGRRRCVRPLHMVCCASVTMSDALQAAFRAAQSAWQERKRAEVRPGFVVCIPLAIATGLRLCSVHAEQPRSSRLPAPRCSST